MPTWLVTTYRHLVFTTARLDRTEEIVPAVYADFGARLAEPEHVHLPVNFPPTVAISRPTSSLNGVLSRRLRQEFPDLRRHYRRASRLRPRS
jgi:putative transposase